MNNMSSPVSAKRRKLNEATNTLKKPFVSPFRSTAPARTPLKDSTNQANVARTPYLPSTKAHLVEAAYVCPSSATARNALSNPRASDLQATPKHKPKAPQWSSRKKEDPEEAAAHRDVAALERQIRRVQNDLDALQQAHKLSTSTIDAELEDLTEKWRLVSQAVAEELFGSVKERVNRMGGVAAWREMERRKYERAHGVGEFAQEETKDDDADCEFDSEGEELPEEEQEYRKKMKRQAKQEAMDAAELPDKPEEEAGQQKTLVWQEAGQDDDVSTGAYLLTYSSLTSPQSFTMDMMLRSLNIELDVIGYDKAAQRWT